MASMKTNCRGVWGLLNVHKNVSIEEFEFQEDSLISKIGESVRFESNITFREHPFSVWIRLGFLVGQRLVTSFVDQRWLVVEGSDNCQIVEFDSLIELIVFTSPAPERIRIAVNSLKISGRKCGYSSKMTSRCRSKSIRISRIKLLVFRMHSINELVCHTCNCPNNRSKKTFDEAFRLPDMCMDCCHLLVENRHRERWNTEIVLVAAPR